MSRRLARETALQVLFQLDVTGENESLEKVIEHWTEEFVVSEKYKNFTIELVEGTLHHKEEIDKMISKTAHEWALDRMNGVDRNLMRLAIYEMLYYADTPQRVTLNEAIEIAKKFGSAESAKFINGILDKLMDSDEK
ncbi:MAG: N utilization substance protein B [Gracilibacter sp. BRH_c7a]|nr:MAG: N utilization substance protein B [Gracilibacter sp. BRH_c7a]